MLCKHALLEGVVGLAPGTFHTMLVKQDGSVWSTGINSDGQSKSFVQVITSGATAAAAGISYSMVLKQDGSVWITGKNSLGQLVAGLQASTGSDFFVQILSGGAKAVAAGGYHSMVLMEGGRVWATGWNKHGQLGDGTTIDRSTFVKVKSGDVAMMAAGFGHSMLVTQRRTVWATGWNSHGQFGDGSMKFASHFVRVTKLSDIGMHDVKTVAENEILPDVAIASSASSTGEV